MRKIQSLFLLACLLVLIGCPTPPPQPPIPPTPEYVTIKVCETSSLLPNPYCPKVIEKQFEKGKEPTTQCGVHKEPDDPPPPPPPKPEKSGIPLFVFAPDILTAHGDTEAFIKSVYEAGAWGVRIFGNYSWGRGWMLTPFKQTGTWTHLTTHETFPYFDLDQWNMAYWERLREVYMLCRKYGMELIVSLLDERPKDKHRKYFSPWYCSKQALDPASSGGVYGDYLKKYHKRFMSVMVDKLNASGVTYRIEPANEFSDLGWVDDGHPDVPKKWYTWFVEAIISEGVEQDRLVHSGWKEAVEHQPGIFCQHRIGLVSQLPGLNFNDKSKVMLSGDGFYEGSGAADQKGRRGINEAEAKALMPKVKSQSYYGYEIMYRGLWKKDNDNANLDDFDPKVVKAMV